MSWRKIDDCWHDFAKEAGLTLESNDRHYGYGIITMYEVNYDLNGIGLSFRGRLVKSTTGVNLNRTDLIISGIALSVPPDYKKLLKKYRAKEAEIVEEGLRIRFKNIFEERGEFEKAIRLASEITTNWK